MYTAPTSFRGPYSLRNSIPNFIYHIRFGISKLIHHDPYTVFLGLPYS